METLCRSWLFIVFLAGWFSAPLEAQKVAAIPDTEATHYIGLRLCPKNSLLWSSFYD